MLLDDYGFVLMVRVEKCGGRGVSRTGQARRGLEGCGERSIKVKQEGDRGPLRGGGVNKP